MAISIRTPASMEECEAIAWLQAEIWGSGIGITPGIFLWVMVKEGCVVLLALDDDRPVGFAYGLNGFTKENRVKFASHQTGVLPAYQDTGLGYRIKLVQRQAVLAKGLDHITWTYDPLQGRNARLNLGKLGAVNSSYIRDFYGDMQDSLNQGLPSDRFNVDWWITTDYVVQHIDGQFVEAELPAETPILNSATLRNDNVPVPAEHVDPPRESYCLVEIPLDIGALKQEAPDMALAWRLQTREIFESAFAAGYVAVNLVRRQSRNYYLLQKDWQPY